MRNGWLESFRVQFFSKRIEGGGVFAEEGNIKDCFWMWEIEALKVAVETCTGGAKVWNSIFLLALSRGEGGRSYPALVDMPAPHCRRRQHEFAAEEEKSNHKNNISTLSTLDELCYAHEVALLKH
jgi:hypothetical protein